MDIGTQHIFASAGWDRSMTDGQVFDEEVRLALLAEELGFDAVWPVEHHFTDYSFCPDNLQFLTYLAGRTERIGLGTAAVILPWNDPLRVAEKVSVLDHLSGGRLRLGMGRGLSRREYVPFRGVEMDETRDRFDEASVMIVRALETGFIEGDGPFYPQPRTEIRPRPERSFRGRTYAVANSPDSIDAAARIGARMVMFSEARWDKRVPAIEKWRARYQEETGEPAPPPMTADFCFCHPDADHAKEAGERYQAAYLRSLLEHYEMTGDHFAATKGYDAYGKQAEALNRIGFDGYLAGFLRANSYGTPDQILEKFEERRGIIGEFELATCFRFGGIPFEEAEASQRLFAAEILPVLKSWS